MQGILIGIISALSAGALAKAKDIGGRVVSDAYEELKAVIARKLGKGGAVQSVEDEPRSEAAQTTLAEALTRAGLHADEEMAKLAEALRMSLAAVPRSEGTADIEVGDITGKVNALVENLVASGRIKLGNIKAETGDAKVTNLHAGVYDAKKR